MSEKTNPESHAASSGAVSPGAARPADGPSRVVLYWIAIGLLTAGTVLALVALLRRPDRVVLVPFDDTERGWYQSHLTEFAEHRHVRLTLVAYKDGAELARLLAADGLQRKGRVLAALAPGEMLGTLASEGTIQPVSTVFGKQTTKTLEEFPRETLDPARVSGVTYFLPDHVSTLVLYYSKARVADAVEHWSGVRARVDADLRAWNGKGLPDDFQLEADPGNWDSYDVAVVATYWAQHAYEGFTVPRIAHAADLQGGADWDLASRAYGAGIENAELVALDGLGLRDAFAWESYFFANQLYHPSMTREGWGRREILSAIAQGQIFMAVLAPEDLFRLHGSGDGDGTGLLRTPSDLGVASLPRFVSLDIDRGHPARVGSVVSGRGGAWWGVPKSAPDPTLARAFVEHVTSEEFQTARSRRFGVLPSRAGLMGSTDLVFSEPWQFEIGREASRQAMRLGRSMPTSERWVASRAGLVRAWREACVDRHEKTPIAIQTALSAAFGATPRPEAKAAEAKPAAR